MKNIFLSFLISNWLATGLYAQSAGINTDGSIPHASSILDIKSTNKGLLIPRMTSAQRIAISTPAIGLTVFDTNSNSFWYYGGTSWINLAPGWSLTGNAGTYPAQFIGTTDYSPVIIKCDNELSGQIGVYSWNTSWGYEGLMHNTDGEFNTAIGDQALLSNTGGSYNSALGVFALGSNTTGLDNTAIGAVCLALNTTGIFNTAIGYSAMYYNTTGARNTASGTRALEQNTTGSDNTATGADVLNRNTTGSRNTANGLSAMYANTTGTDNTATGFQSLMSNTEGDWNTADGANALFGNTLGFFNTAVGYQAMSSITTGSTNTAIGAFCNVTANYLSNATAIGYNTIVNASNKVRIGNTAITVIEGQVPFTTPSDGRFKYNVKEDVRGLDFILQLRPVTYQFDVKKFDTQLHSTQKDYKEDNAMQASFDKASAIRRTGFIAQEVEQALIKTGYDFSGIIKPQSENEHYSLSYESFVVPLVKAVQEQQKIIEDLKKRIEALEKNK